MQTVVLELVVKSKGGRRRTREKYRGPEKLTVNKLIRHFDIGQSVALKVSSNSQDGMPFRRFHGKTGKIIEQRGRAYVVEIKDINKTKKVIARPEHIKAV
jgi:large subunit ribosomal protein L21e